MQLPSERINDRFNELMKLYPNREADNLIANPQQAICDYLYNQHKYNIELNSKLLFHTQTDHIYPPNTQVMYSHRDEKEV